LAVGMQVRKLPGNESEGGTKVSPRDPRGIDLANIPDAFFAWMSADVAADAPSMPGSRGGPRQNIGIEFLLEAPRSSAPSPPRRFGPPPPLKVHRTEARPEMKLNKYS
jgi:hypothetical protein